MGMHLESDAGRGGALMFSPRTIRTSMAWRDGDGAKLYTIATDARSVDHQPFLQRLAQVKSLRSVHWPDVAHFAIFHHGASMLYLVLCWWGNDNELFTSVSVLVGEEWVERPDLYSFCLYDLEVFWDERNRYVETMDCLHPNLDQYRNSRRAEWMAPPGDN